MNNDLQQFSEERLMKIISTHAHDEVAALARIALSAKQAKPVGRIEGWNDHEDIYIIQWFGNQQDLPKGATLYTTPQPAHTEQDGWIKCSERMPDPCVEIVIRTSHGEVIAGETDVVGFLDLHDGTSVRMSGATHWMPLPAATKPESER
jgi:hypothetical protein